MPYLIDGNNLMHAYGREVGRGALCKRVAPLAEAGQRVGVVFDGPAPDGPLASQIEVPGVEVAYAGKRTADEVIIEAIRADSAPRRLIVVSTDRQIRTAARRRRCVSMTAADFIEHLDRVEEQLHRPPPVEPKEKRTGLAEGEVDKWLKEFGL